MVLPPPIFWKDTIIPFARRGWIAGNKEQLAADRLGEVALAGLGAGEAWAGGPGRRHGSPRLRPVWPLTQVARVLWWYYFSKLIEFLDTVFFVLRKKTSQITFLHVYHHASMFNIWWCVLNWIPCGQSKYAFVSSV